MHYKTKTHKIQTHKQMSNVTFSLLSVIGGGAYWAGRATAAHFQSLWARPILCPPTFLWLKTYFFIIQQRHGMKNTFCNLLRRELTAWFQSGAASLLLVLRRPSCVL